MKARVVPLVAAAQLAMLNEFIIIDLGDEDENAVLYREAQLEDQIDESPEMVRLYRGRFERMWNAALSEEATVRRIEARAAAMISSLDSGRPDVGNAIA